MESLILLFVLLLFWVYISWDRDRMEAQAKQAAKEQPTGSGVFPRALISVPALLVSAAALAAIAAALAIRPPAPPFTGRGSLFTALIYAALGPYGLAIVVSALALACIAVALACLKKRVA
jgi:hypothetical protein